MDGTGPQAKTAPADGSRELPCPALTMHFRFQYLVSRRSGNEFRSEKGCVVTACDMRSSRTHDSAVTVRQRGGGVLLHAHGLVSGLPATQARRLSIFFS